MADPGDTNQQDARRNSFSRPLAHSTALLQRCAHPPPRKMQRGSTESITFHVYDPKGDTPLTAMNSFAQSHEDEEQGAGFTMSQFVYDGWAQCWTATFQTSSEVAHFGCTLHGATGLFPLRIAFEGQQAVFAGVYASADEGAAFEAWMRSIWTVFRDDPTSLGLAHATLLLSCTHVPAFADLAPIYDRILDSERGQDAAPATRLMLMSLFGQYLEHNEGRDIAEVLLSGTEIEVLWRVVGAETWHALPTLDDVKTIAVDVNASGRRQQLMQNAQLKTFARRAYLWLYNFDRLATVPSFRFVGLPETLQLLEEELITNAFGLPVGDHSLQKSDLPDFKNPSRNDMPATAQQLQHTSALAWNLEMSETLQEREVNWQKAVSQATGTLQRSAMAKRILKEERVWLMEMVRRAGAARGGLRSEQEHLLADRAKAALSTLDAMHTEVYALDDLALTAKAQNLTVEGRRLRMNTRDLLRDYGRYVGVADGESFAVNTYAGIAKVPETRSADGPLGSNGTCLCPTSIIELNGNIFFTETSTNRIRVIGTINEHVQTLIGHNGAGSQDGVARVATIRAPRSLVTLSEAKEEFLFIDGGSRTIKMLHKMKDIEQDGNEVWGVTRLSNPSRQSVDGTLRQSAGFANPQCMLDVTDANGRNAIFVGDAGNLRRIVGGIVTGRVTTIATTPAMYAVTAMAYARDSDTLFVADGHCVKAIKMEDIEKSKAPKTRVVFGEQRSSGLDKLNHPLGICYFRTPRTVPLPERSGADLHQDVVEEQQIAKLQAKNPAQAEAMRAEKDAREQRHRKSIPTLLIADSMNQCVKVIYSRGWKYNFEAVDVDVAVGRCGSKKPGWKDGLSTAAICNAPQCFAPRADGGYWMGEDYRMRILAPPHTLVDARDKYRNIQMRIEMLADEIVERAKASNIHSAMIVENIRHGRSQLLDARKSIETESYREYVEHTVAKKLACLPAVVAAAPSAEMLLWVVQRLMAVGLVDVNDMVHTNTISSEMAEIPHSLSSMARPLSIVDAVEEAAGRIQWSPTAAEQVQVLRVLTKLAKEVPDVVSSGLAIRVLSHKLFRMPPCAELFEFISHTVPGFDKYGTAGDEEMQQALGLWVSSAVLKADMEKLTSEKLLRGVLRLWVEYYGQKDAKAGAGNEDAVAMRMCEATLTYIMRTESQKSLFAEWVGRGLSNLIAEDATDMKQAPVYDDEAGDVPEQLMGIVMDHGAKELQALPFQTVFNCFTRPPGVPVRTRDTEEAKDKRRKGDDDDDEVPCVQFVLTYRDSKCLYHLMGECLMALPFMQGELSVSTIYQPSKYPINWAGLFFWYTATVKRSTERNAFGPEWDRLAGVCKKIGIVFKGVATSIRTQEATVDVIRRCIATKAEMVPLFTAIGEKGMEQVLADADIAITDLFRLAGTCVEVAVALFEESPFTTDLCNCRQNWGSAPLRVLLRFFRRDGGFEVHADPEAGIEEPENTAGEPRPVPRMFLESVTFLRAMKQSSLFMGVWDGTIGECFAKKKSAEDSDAPPAPAPAPLEVERDLADRISAAIKEFYGIGVALDDGTLSYAELADLRRLLSPEHLANFTAQGGKPSRSGVLHGFARVMQWFGRRPEDTRFSVEGLREPPNTVDAAFLGKITGYFDSFDSLCRVRHQQDELERCVSLMAKFTSVLGMKSVRQVQCALADTVKKVCDMDWATVKVDTLKETETIVGSIDMRMCGISLPLLEQLNAHPTFLTWLQDFPSDQNFTSAIEIAIGKPEMECPPELWVSGEGNGAGHCDEGKLSLLTGVRAALHKFLYGSTKEGLLRDSLKDVIGCFIHLDTAAGDAQAAAIQELVQIQNALAELLSADDASASRLANLYLESWNARWVLSAAAQRSGVELHLDYSVQRETATLEARQTVPQLLDFQSAVVLARESAVSAPQVPIFVAQFGWARDLAAALDSMKTAGHPAYQEFTNEIVFSTPPEDMQRLVEDAKRELGSWTDKVAELRRRFPRMTALTLQQLLRVVRAFKNDGPNEGDVGAVGIRSSMKDVVSEIHTSIFPGAKFKDVYDLLAGVWAEDGDANTPDGFIGCLDMMMNVAPQEWMVLPSRHVRQGAAVTRKRGAELVVTEPEDVVSTILSGYVHMGILPEWHSVLWICPTTPAELILNTVYRWAYGDVQDTSVMYCIAGLEAMPEDLYHTFVSLLLEHHPTAKHSLLLLSTVREHYVVRQLAHWQTNLALLSADDLGRVGAALSTSQRQVRAYVSAHAGAGKSFAVAHKAGTLGVPVVRVPLHRELTAGEVIALIDANKPVALRDSPKAPYVIHLDVSDTVTAASSILLFELVVLGSLYDSDAGRRWFLRKNVSLLIEAAPSVCQLSVFQCLERENLVVNADTFKYDERSLELGMRSEFKGRRHDGLVYNTNHIPSSAYHRLAWVNYAISLVDKTHAVGNATFLSKMPSDTKPDATTFHIVCRAAGLQEPVSLWSFWAFVDVLYWSLASAFSMESSPLLKAFAGPQKATPELCKTLRAECFDFICRTSSDFATRQQRASGDEYDWLCTTERTYATDGSGLLGSRRDYYKRAQFCSNGQPVFRMGTYLDPTYVMYSKADGWIITGTDWSNPTLTGKPWKNGTMLMECELMMSKDIAKEQPALYDKACKEDNIIERVTDEALGDLKSWNEANHEAMLVSSDTLAVLGINAIALKKRMHPELLQYFEANGVDVGATGVSDRAVLSSLTNVQRSDAEAGKLLGGTYCMTRDVVLKMLAVFIRVRCGVPVVLMGECGCGKTHMLRYVCAWLGAELLILDVHGGTTERDIEGIFEDAQKRLKENPKADVYVFLDEVNTCPHMGLIAEVIVGRTMHGMPLSNRIHVLAACNPYRRKRVRDDAVAVGLAYQAPKRSDLQFSDGMEDLVYRVHPIPKRLLDYVFDFGSLTDAVEAKYVRSMVEVYIDHAEAHVYVTKWLIAAQVYIREAEGDPSVVSLRDLKRALKLSRWFAKYGASKVPAGKNKWATPALLGIMHVFYFRLPSDEQRSGLVDVLRKAIRPPMQNKVWNYGTKQFEYEYADHGFAWLYPAGAMEKVLTGLMQSLCGKLEVEPGIAMNQALRENLYVTMICIFNKMPTFVVGKPGTSKTLTLQVLANNLKGEQSTSPFWQRFPALYIFPYQCSPLSTAAGIRHQYDIACSYQKKSTKTIVILLLDEVGLAEHSPDMPLKVLHGILVNPPIAIVGLSNWTLDAAKMNRAICLQRPEPATQDIHLTGEHILGLSEGDNGFLRMLSMAYHAVYTGQTGREFIGMRDFYYMLKLLRREMAQLDAMQCVTEGMQFLANGVDYSAKVLTVVSVAADEELGSGKYVRFLENEEAEAESVVIGHVRNERLVPFRVLSRGQLAARLVGSTDPLDEYLDHGGLLAEARERRQKDPGVMPVSGSLLVYALMRNFGGHERVVEAVKDAFSRHVAVEGRPAFEDRAALEKVCLPPLRLVFANLNDPTSRHLMVLTDNGAALPLLFETHMLDPARTDVLVGSTFRDDAHELHLIQQVNKVKAAMAAGRIVILHNHDSIYESLYDVLNQRYVTSTVAGREKRMLRLAIGSRSQLCPVEDGFKIVVVAEKQHAHENLDLPLLNRFEKQYLNYRECLSSDDIHRCAELEGWINQVRGETTFTDPAQVFCGFNESTLPSLVFSHTGASQEELQAVLARIALPIAVMQSPSLSAALPSYMEQHAGLQTLLRDVLPCGVAAGRLGVVITHSPVEQVQVSGDLGMQWTTLRLGEIGSENSLRYNMGKFFSQDGSGLLTVQCDPMTSPQQTIDHARRVAEALFTEWASARAAESTQQKHIFFIVHTPPGARHRARSFSVVFSRIWQAYFIDDVSDDGESTLPFLSKSIPELIEEKAIDLPALIKKRVYTAVSLLKEPPGLSTKFTKKVHVVSKLLGGDEDTRFMDFIIRMVTKIFDAHCKVGGSGLHHQVELAIGTLSAGSLKVSLQFVVEYLVVQALSHVLLSVDTNANLAALSGRTADLWFALLNKMDSDGVIDSAKLDGMPTVRVVPNTGKFHPLSAKFPFSFCLIDIHEKARVPLMGQASINYDALSATCEQLHGAAIVDAWRRFSGDDHTAYYHDLVGSRAYCPPGMDWNVVHDAYEIILRASEPRSFSNPLALHVAFWQNEERMFYLCSLLGSLGDKDQAEVLTSARSAAAADMNAALVDAVVARTFSNLRATGTTQGWARWTQSVYPGLALDVKALGGDIERLDLVASFAEDVLMPCAGSHLQDDARAYYLTALGVMPFEVPALLGVLRGAPTPVPQDAQDRVFITFLSRFILPKRVGRGLDDAGLQDVLRLSCGLRPKLWPGAEPMTQAHRRALLNTLVAHTSLEEVLRLGGALKMGPKAVQALFHAMLEYVEDTTDCHALAAAPITDKEVTLVKTLVDAPTLLQHNILVTVVKVRAQIVRYAEQLREAFAELIAEGPRKPGRFAKAPETSLNFKRIVEMPGAAELVARSLTAAGGVDAVVDVMQMGKTCNWFWQFQRHVAENSIGDEVVPDTTVFVSSYTNIDAVVVPFRESFGGDNAAQKRAVELLGNSAIPSDLKLIGIWSAVFSQTQREGREKSQLWDHLVGLSPPKDLDLAKRLLEAGGWSSRMSNFWQIEAKTKAKLSRTVMPSVKMLLFHLALMLPQLEGTFIYKLANNPVLCKHEFWPGMPSEEVDIVTVMGHHEYLTWYKCPNGHLYSIGECGGAMEIGRCSHPSCNAAIGGRNHSSLPGNTRIGGADEVRRMLKSAGRKEIRGISLDAGLEDVRRHGVRQDPVNIGLVRFWIYAALTLNSLKGKDVATALKKGCTNSWIHTSLVRTYAAIAARQRHLPPTELLVAMHTLCDDMKRLWLSQKVFSATSHVSGFEQAFYESSKGLFTRGSKELQAKLLRLGTSEKEALFENIAPAPLARAVGAPYETPEGDKHVFKFLPEVSLVEFKGFFASGMNALEYPLLGAVCEMESRLDIVKYLADMLELQHALFEALHGVDMTRLEASELPAVEAIHKYVREADRPRVLHALDGYCALFNKAMPFLENLYECQENPFLNAQGEVDIGGGVGGARTPLSPQAPLSFMLPSLVPGHVDAAGLSSIQLGALVHRTQNRILDQLSAILPTQDAEPGAAMTRTVTLTQSTPPEVVRRVLIAYDKDTDLIPLLYKYKQHREATTCGYDLAALERELATKMLRGKVAVQLNLRHFQYAGEVRQRGGLAALNNLEQSGSLPTMIESALAQEMTTQQQVRLLFRVLEDATNFAAAMGGDLDPDTSMAAFFTDVMGMEADVLPSLLSKAVYEHAKLRHLKALFLYVEGLSSGGGMFESVPSKYKQDLTEELEAGMKRAVGFLHVANTMSAVRDLLLGPLSDPEVKFPGSECLKDYIGYQDMDVGNADWFEEHFPEELELQHAVAVFELLQKLAQRQ